VLREASRVQLPEPYGTLAPYLSQGPENHGFSDKFLVLDNQWLASPIILSENAGMKYGYASVSTDDQNPALQTAALKKAGCKKIFEDRGISGVVAKRPSLTRCVNTLQAGDTLIVWKLNRLGRSLRDLITFLTLPVLRPQPATSSHLENIRILVSKRRRT
jgi:resolvase-like protein